jgi:transposase-like protein
MPGLMGALEIVYARIPRQHCWAHKGRGILDNIPKRQRAALKRDLNRISHSTNRQEANSRYGRIQQHPEHAENPVSCISSLKPSGRRHAPL